MKRFTILLTLLCLCKLGFSQNERRDTIHKKHNNIIAIDATGLLKQFFNFNSNSYYSYPYMITYRRIIGKNAIRLGAGANIDTKESNTNDTVKSKSVRNSYTVGLGYERYAHLSRRWSFYYGVEFTAAYLNYTDKNWFNSTSNRESSTITNKYGIAPILGIVYKINRRISVGTETSYNLSYVLTTTKSKTIPSNYYDFKTVDRGFQTNFITPTNLSFRFSF